VLGSALRCFRWKLICTGRQRAEKMELTLAFTPALSPRRGRTIRRFSHFANAGLVRTFLAPKNQSTAIDKLIIK